ncbi:MAG: OmpA family protein [Acidobacteriia bacterium]|nr:OmpA family protein [Terriglobia bacterium]
MGLILTFVVLAQTSTGLAATQASDQSFFTVKRCTDGAGIQTFVFLTNSSDIPVQYTVEGYTSSDQPARILLADPAAKPSSLLTGTLTPHASVSISTWGRGLNSRPVEGWIRVEADRPIEITSSTRAFDGGKSGGGGAHVDDADLARPSTTRGPTGLFHVQNAENLRHKEWNVGLHVDNLDRMPGDLDITSYNFSFAYGVTNRVEFSAMVEAQKGVKVGQPNLLSTYQPPTQGIFPGTGLQRLQLFTPNGFIPCAGCNPGFYNDIPLVSGKRFQQDLGDIYLNLKFNLLSQSRGSPIGIAVTPFFKIPTAFSAAKLDRGRGTGAIEGGADLIFSRVWGDLVGTHFNAGLSLLDSPKLNGIEVVGLSKKWNFSFGLNVPNSSRVQFIGEILSTIYWGGSPNTSFDARDPVDGLIGLRMIPARWISLSGGYRRNLNQFSRNGFGDGNGYVAQVQFHSLPEKPIPPNHPPTVTCSASPDSVQTGGTVRLTATASDPDNDPLSYVWKTGQGKLTQDNATASWDTTGLAAGSYTLSVHVSDGKGGTADCSTTVTVTALPAPVNHPPVCNATADRTTLLSGERTRLVANASDPDGDPLTYQWSATAGQITGTGDTVSFVADGPGPATITVTVNDGKGGSTPCSVAMTVQSPPAPPEAQHLADVLFKLNSARVDNLAKAQLDDLALKLQQDPKAHVVLIGHADKGELNAQRLSKQRAENTKAYLVKDKKIDAARIEVRDVGTTKPADTGKTQDAYKKNRRVEMIFVPEGATF